MQTLREFSEKIANMWVYELNGESTPDTITYGSGKEFWWKCSKNPKHIFQKKVCNMFNRKTGEPIGCVYCEAERPLPFPGETDLFSICPSAKYMWDFDRNKKFDTECIHSGTPDKAWFHCEEGHIFQRDICRFVENQECPDCRKLKNVIVKFLHMVRQWDFTKNRDININLTSAYSSQTANWRCKKCGYEWTAKISSRRASKGECPCCETRIVVKSGVTDLFSVIPDLKDEYNTERNSEIDFLTLSVTSAKPVWWKCKNSHEWLVSPNARIKTKNKEYIISKCPHCQGVKRLVSYAEEFPDLLRMFLPEKNHMDFKEITPKQRLEQYWWQCQKCMNDFRSSVQAMKRSYNTVAKGCPYCAGKKVSKEKSFAFLHPELMDEYDSVNEIDPYNSAEKSGKQVKWICRDNKEHRWEASFKQRANEEGKCPLCRGWHYNIMLYQERPDLEKYYDKNKNSRKFNSYSYKSNEKVWWNCDNGHSFISAIHHMCIRDIISCPICENRSLEIGINDLASQFFELAQEFDCKKNVIMPNQIIYSSIKEYWWRCNEAGHEFLRSPYYRTSRCNDCPVCARTMIVKGVNDFQNAYPNIVYIWDYKKNAERPDQISDRNKGKFAFKCNLGHEYESYLSTEIFNDCNCLICNNVLIQVGVNSLLDTDFDLAQEFSPLEERNPAEFSKNMSYSILWRCPICNGDYRYPIKDRELHDDSCPYCNRNHVLLNFNSLVDTDLELSKEWSPNNERGPESYCKTFKTYVKWICPECNGEYSASIYEREIGDDSCPYCSNKKPLKGRNSLADTHKELAEEWSPNNDKTPYEVLKQYTYPVKWVCQTCGGEYIAKINEREIGDDACPYCRGYRVLPDFNSFYAKHKDLMLEWSYNDNYILGNPNYISEDNHRKQFWWICQICNHKYLMTLAQKVYYKKRNWESCPYCKGMRQKKKYCL